VIVVVNMADRAYDSYTIGFPRPGLWTVRFNSDWRGYSEDFNSHPSLDTTAESGERDGVPFHGSLGLGRYSAVMLSQER
jgi:1,4-alpha-glucan branching enzyme